ncbi:hypothetical protein GOV12_08250 [Candidatus Pacearchaeota archaeon]|nr:hypothetical protein [Candidatus Pacearchaeota archaeon]
MDKKRGELSKKAQISIEYLIIIGFVSFVLIIIIGLALFYSGSIKDSVRVSQVGNFANKIISSAESIYYYGEPSKTTESVYLPDGVTDINISNNNLYVTLQLSSGIEKTSYSSNVPIDGVISTGSGMKKIEISAGQNKTTINSI